MPGIIDPNEIVKNFSPEQLKEFGTIVGMDSNVVPEPTPKTVSTPSSKKKVTTVSVEKKIKELLAPVEVVLKLSAEQHERLTRLCFENNQTKTEYITDVVLSDLESRIGRAAISGPSKIGNVSVGKKVVGPSNQARIR